MADYRDSFAGHLVRQMAHSHATFGPGRRTAGVVAHIRKELEEVLTSEGSPLEWADVVILALDGLTREIAFITGQRRDPDEVARLAVELIRAKVAKNERREWPDWRGFAEGQPIEHKRGIED